METPGCGVFYVAVANVVFNQHSRSEILYGRPALAALRTQRDALHQLFHAYSGDFENRRGAKGFRRATFVQVRLVALTKTSVPLSLCVRVVVACP